MNMRNKKMGVLKVNVLDLPYKIATWKQFGATEKVERGQKILRDSIAEIERRESLRA